MSKERAIILTHNTLEAAGLKHLLTHTLHIEAHIADETFFSTFNANAEPHYYFIDPSTLLSNLSFFLPRKAKTIVIASSNEPVEDIKSLNVLMPEDCLVESLSELIESNHHDEPTSSTLSSRETEVLRLVAHGKLNKEIAQELNISINTVLSHRKNITAKLGIKSVSGLSFYAMMNGIV